MFIGIAVGLLTACNGSASAASVPRAEMPVASATADSWSVAKLAGVYHPIGVAVDSAGNTYATNEYGNVLKINSNGTKSKIAIIPESAGMAVRNGYVYVAGHAEVAKIASDGKATLIGRNWDEPTAVAVDSTGNVYVADRGLQTVIRVRINGDMNRIRPFFRFITPYGLAVDGNKNVYVTSVPGSGDAKVYKVPPGGDMTTIGSDWRSPTGIAVSSGIVFVADFGAKQIIVIKKISTVIIPGSLGFGAPIQIATNGSGDLFVSSRKEAIYKLTH